MLRRLRHLVAEHRKKVGAAAAVTLVGGGYLCVRKALPVVNSVVTQLQGVMMKHMAKEAQCVTCEVQLGPVVPVPVTHLTPVPHSVALPRFHCC